jgi:hemolysin III
MAGKRSRVPTYDAGVSFSPVRPRFRGRLHQIGFALSLPAGAVLVLTARDGVAAAVAAIYAVTLSAVLGTSAAYHRGMWSATARRWMKRLDHSMIFLLIAGSYTPVCVLVLDQPWTVVLLAVVWSGAVVGVTLKLVRIEGFRRLTGFLYLALGWVAVFALPQILRDVSPATATLMIAGGVLYTLGAIVLARRRPDPAPSVFGYHEVWHAFMVAAAACHYVMIFLVVRGTG